MGEETALPGSLPEMVEQATRALCARDPVLRAIVGRAGPCTLSLEPDAFRALAESIIYQQLATKVAATICRRFLALYPDRDFPSPSDVLNTSDEALRAAGLSGRKALYLKDLAQKCLDGTLTPSLFPAMSDQEIADQLVKVKGIGRWTAHMFLIFSLGRPNVLPGGDFGFRKAVQQHYGPVDGSLDARLAELGALWAPYCTVATWYLWRSLDATPLDGV